MSIVASPAPPSTAADNRPYLIFSSDSHAGPSLTKDLRRYCPAAYIADFDAYAESYWTAMSRRPNMMIQDATEPVLRAYEDLMRCEGLRDPNEFLKDQDAEGIAAQLIFAGGGNLEPLPWSDGFNAGDPTTDATLRRVGGQIWNEWLADFVSVSPERLLGVMQLPIWDLDEAIETVRWGKEHGLRAINFPAPRPDYPAYNDRAYDRFWSAVEDVDLPLVCHVASGVRPDATGKGALLIYSTELQFYSRRAFAQMAFGGVFDRHPRLRVGFVEQRAGWIPEHLRELDSCVLDPRRSHSDRPDRLPSDYWRDNCFVGCSFMAHFEAELRHEMGLSTVLWGSDYPHIEGTWQRTLLSLRKTFAGIPTDEVRAILGENAVRLFTLDTDVLQPVAEGIGPRPDEVNRSLAADEVPDHVGLAFREFGPFA